MTTDVLTRVEGRAGRITLNRPAALNALNHEMTLAIDAALTEWRDDPRVEIVVIEASGERAFCAGGDIAALYHAGRAGNAAASIRFWVDEYRMNAKIAEFPKPVVAFMQGFVMGGGVGLGGHARLRIVGETSQIAMPECGIGLIPDVGGTLLLARAPGKTGAYLGVTGARMTAGDAVHAGFADAFLPEADWPRVKAEMIRTGCADIPEQPAPPSELRAAQAEIDACFQGDMHEIQKRVARSDHPILVAAAKAIARNSPLSMVATLRLIDMTHAQNTIRGALENELRFTARAVEQSDFLEGVRAQIIEKDRAPRWGTTLTDLDPRLVDALLAPLPAELAIRF